MNNKEQYFKEKKDKLKSNREAFIVSKLTRKVMTLVNEVSIHNNHDIHYIEHHHNHNQQQQQQQSNSGIRTLEYLLEKLLHFFNEFDTKGFVDTFIESEGILSLKKIVEMNPSSNNVCICIVSSIDILIKLTRYDNDIRVMIHNLGKYNICINTNMNKI